MKFPDFENEVNLFSGTTDDFSFPARLYLVKSHVPRDLEPKCEIRKSFAAAFKKWRRKNKVPIKQIAADLNVSIATIDLWESGKRFPTGEHFEMLATYTGQSPCELFCIMARRCKPGKCLLAGWDGSSL